MHYRISAHGHGRASFNAWSAWYTLIIKMTKDGLMREHEISNITPLTSPSKKMPLNREQKLARIINDLHSHIERETVRFQNELCGYVIHVLQKNI